MSDKKKQPTRQWVYRPTEAEHELLLRAMERSPEYPSIAQFVREATLRLIHADDRRSLFTELSEAIDELHETKKKFLTLVLRQSEEP